MSVPKTPSRRFELPRLLPAGMQRPVLSLLSGSLIAQAAVYAARPVLTRLFTPEEFGLLAFFVAVASTLTVASAGRLDDALMLPKRQEDAAGLFGGAGILLVISSILSLPIALWKREVAAFFGQPEAAPFLALVPVALLLIAGVRLCEQWLMRHERFGSVSRRRVLQSFITVPVQLALGVAGVGAIGLIGGVLAGYLGAALLLGVSVSISHGALIKRSFQPARIKRLIGRYRKFPMVAVPSALLNTASVHLPVLLLVFFFEAEVAGLYGLAYAMLLVPMSLLGTSIGQVFFVKAAEAVRTNLLAGLTRDVFQRLVMIGLFPMLAVTLAGPEIFSTVFGAEWQEAGVYAQYLAVWIFFVCVSSPLSRLFDVLERQPAELAFNVVLLITRVVVISIGGILGDARLAVALFGISGAVLWLAQNLWIMRMAGVAYAKVAVLLGQGLMYSLLPLMLVALALITLDPLLTTVVVVGAGLLYLLILYVARGRLSLEIGS